MSNPFMIYGFLNRGPSSTLRIIKTMLEDKDVFVRRCREGYEFFKSLRQRKEDLAAARTVSAAATSAGA